MAQQEGPAARTAPAGIAALLARPFLELTDAEREALVAHFAPAADTSTLPYRWREIPFNRLALVNYLAGTLPRSAAYLEIGCAADTLFRAVPLEDKTGVDPKRGGTHRMTSDDFFAANDRTFDLVWIDGLHEYRQVHRDIDNALAVLRPGGWIGVHDVLPLNWKMEHMPRVSMAWTGDVWKAAFEVAATRGVEMQVVTVDHGIAVIRATGIAPRAPLADLSATLADQRFGYLRANLHRLPLNDWSAGLDWIDARTTPAPRA